MNGMENRKVPKFLENESIPKEYFEPVNPYMNPPSTNIDLGKLTAYAKENGKTQWDLTKDEVDRFKITR